MNTRHTIVYGIFAVMFALACTALSMTACDNGGGGGGGGGTPLSGTITITNASGSPVTTSPVAIKLFAGYNGGTETVSFQWQRGTTNVGTGDEYTPTEAGSYTVIVSADGYQSKTSAPVTVTALPELSGNVILNPSYITAVVGVGMYATYEGNTNEGRSGQFQWKRGSDIVHTEGSTSLTWDDTPASSSSYTPTETGNYTVTFTNANGYKTSEAVAIVAALEMPSGYIGTWVDTDDYSTATLTISSGTIRWEYTSNAGNVWVQYDELSRE